MMPCVDGPPRERGLRRCVPGGPRGASPSLLTAVRRTMIVMMCENANGASGMIEWAACPPRSAT